MKELLSKKMLERRKGMFLHDSPNIALQKNETHVDIYTHNYLEDQHPLHKLNIYIKKGCKEKIPLLIDVHGGGWVYGDKDLNGLLCMDFAKRGFITVAMSYRLLPENKLIDMIQDIFASLHFLYRIKDQYPIDFNQVSIMGDSAGGHLNLLCNAINNSNKLLEYFNVKKLPFKIHSIVANHPAPFIENPIREEGFVRAYRNLCYGKGYPKSPVYKYSSIDKFGKFLDKSTKILVTTSKNDDIVREQAFMTIELLNKLKVPFDFYDESGEGSWHVYNVTQPFRDISVKCNDYIENFIRLNFKKEEK